MLITLTSLGKETFSPQQWSLTAWADPESLIKGVQLSSETLFFFSLMRGERIQIPLKAGHQRPASEFNGVLLAGR